MMVRSHVRDGLRSLWVAACLILVAVRASAVEFEVTLDPRVAPQPVSGRLYVFLSQGAGDLRQGPNWFNPEPFFRLDVRDFQPGTTRTIDDSTAGFPEKVSKLPPGKYRAQAVLAHDIYSCAPGRGAGNLFGPVVEASIVAAQAGTIRLALDQVVKGEAFPDIKWIKEIVVTSDLLGKFHQSEVLERAAVVLPASYFGQPERRYPVIYMVPSFGGSYHEALQFANQSPQADPGDEEFIRVMLDGQCEWGHHVYADSATNGPRGQALVAEMIPEIDRRFRTVAKSAARFLAGHSSGGWSSLWLQVNYPDVFGGVWSSSPDPVDFRDFQRIDLYADPPLNVYRDPQNNRRPLARQGENPVLWFDSFCKMDDVLGRGGQLRSFEAAFSPLDADGLPRKLWDRASGQIDPETAKAWQAYDIRFKLERNWKELEPKLRGKLHITTGSLDTFYLEGAVVRLAEFLKQLGSDAEITVVPAADHTTVLTPDYFRRARRQMAEAYRKSLAAQ